jgi:small subunit ribosomal protein S9
MADEPTDNTDEQPEPASKTPNADETTSAEAAQEETPEQSDAADQQPPVAEQPTDALEPQHAAEEPAAAKPAAAKQSYEQSASGAPASGAPASEAPASEAPAAEAPAAEAPTSEEPASEEPASEEPAAEAPASEEPVAQQAATGAPADADADTGEAEPEEEAPAPRVKPSVPGAHLEVDIVPEGVDPLAPEQPADPYALEDDDETKSEDEEAEVTQLSEPISSAAIDLAAGARYKATGKRKTAIARVILRPGSGIYVVNGRALDEHFPRVTLQRNIRQPLETVGYQERMDVHARLHGGGISAQAGALRHGISRALLEADPNLRGELKRRGFLTRDSRAKERKKAGLKKARKRPQFSKR